MSGLNPQGLGQRKNYDELTTDEGSIRSQKESYHVKTDGTTVWAIPQRDGLDRLENTDIGPLWEELVVNQLEPTGTAVEARGHVHFTAPQTSTEDASYPGDVSNNAYNGMVLPAQCWVSGEVASHNQDTENATIATVRADVRIPFTQNGLVVPGETSEQMIWPRVEGIHLYGPGDTDNGSVGVQGTGTSNTWDFLELKRVVVSHCDNPIELPDSGHKLINDSLFYRYAGDGTLNDRTWVKGTTFSPANDGCAIVATDTAFLNCEFDGVGESRQLVRLFGESFVGGATKFRKTNSTTGTGSALFIDSDTAPALGDIRFKESPDGGSWAQCVDVFDGDPKIRGVRDYTSSTNSIRINGNGGAADVTISDGCHLPNGVSEINSPPRTVRNGRYLTPPTLSLGGTDGSIAPTKADVSTYDIFVDAGGSVTELEGITNIAEDNTYINIIHTGGEDVTIVHNDTTSSEPLLTNDSTSKTLTNNGDTIQFRYSAARNRWVEIPTV